MVTLSELLLLVCAEARFTPSSCVTPSTHRVSFILLQVTSQHTTPHLLPIPSISSPTGTSPFRPLIILHTERDSLSLSSVTLYSTDIPFPDCLFLFFSAQSCGFVLVLNWGPLWRFKFRWIQRDTCSIKYLLASVAVSNVQKHICTSSSTIYCSHSSVWSCSSRFE